MRNIRSKRTYTAVQWFPPEDPRHNPKETPVVAIFKRSRDDFRQSFEHEVEERDWQQKIINELPNGSIYKEKDEFYIKGKFAFGDTIWLCKDPQYEGLWIATDENGLISFISDKDMELNYEDITEKYEGYEEMSLS